MKGKPLSLGANILGAFITIGALVLKATISPHLDIDAAIKVAAFVVLVFAPIDLSMIFKNIFEPLGMRKVPDSYQNDYTGVVNDYPVGNHTDPDCSLWRTLFDYQSSGETGR